MEENKKKLAILESLKIDALSNRWVARLLFLFVFILYSMTRIYPVGDSDFSRVAAWYVRFTEMGAVYSPDIGLPKITLGNVIYLGFEVVLIFVFIFIAMLYTAVYLSDKNQMKASAGIIRYIKSLPSLILFVFLLALFFAFPMLTFPPLILLIVPPLFLVPPLIIQKKVNAIDAIMLSLKKTYGLKLSIIIHILALGLLFSALIFLFAIVIDPTFQAFRLIEGFLMAYFVLSFGRLLGVIYEISLIRDSITEKKIE